MGEHFDRAKEDLGNIVALEHVNVTMPDQRLATIFYVTGMGFTRDPYRSIGVGGMWINVGRSQFHLPTGDPQVLRGHVGLVIPNHESLLDRLSRVKAELGHTSFSYTEHDAYVEVTSPWGNRLRCYEPERRFGHINLGMPYVEFEVQAGAAAPIAEFYNEVFGAPATTGSDAEGSFARCPVGDHQEFIFREVERPIPHYDGHHVQIYVADFSGPHTRLKKRELVTEESSEWQYRFKDIVDVNSGDLVFSIEHEVRSMTHPLFGRRLVNRNPNVSPNDAGREDWDWVALSKDE